MASRIYNLNVPYIALRGVEINLAIFSKVSVIDTIKLPQTRVSHRPNRLSACLNSKFFCREGSLKYEPTMCREFLIHELAQRSLWSTFLQQISSSCTTKILVTWVLQLISLHSLSQPITSQHRYDVLIRQLTYTFFSWDKLHGSCNV